MNGTSNVRERDVRGQAFVETTLLMPVYLLLLFLAIQIGHLGIAIAIVNYAASSIARQAVTANTFDQGTADQRFKGLLSAGVKPDHVTGADDNTPLTPNITVTACASLPAYPFVGVLLDKALKAQSDNTCANGGKAFGPVALKGPAPFSFVIEGKAIARMNYKP
jgi:Flp pilus assembly protein TadG